MTTLLLYSLILQLRGEDHLVTKSLGKVFLKFSSSAPFLSLIRSGGVLKVKHVTARRFLAGDRKTGPTLTSAANAYRNCSHHMSCEGHFFRLLATPEFISFNLQVLWKAFWGLVWVEGDCLKEPGSSSEQLNPVVTTEPCCQFATLWVQRETVSICVCCSLEKKLGRGKPSLNPTVTVHGQNHLLGVTLTCLQNLCLKGSMALFGNSSWKGFSHSAQFGLKLGIMRTKLVPVFLSF